MLNWEFFYKKGSNVVKKYNFLFVFLTLILITCENNIIDPISNSKTESKQIFNKFLLLQFSENGAGKNYMYFFDSQNGIAVGNSGAVFSTSDSGSSWVKSSAPKEVNLWRAYGIDKNYWFCSTIHLTDNFIYKVEDNTWTQLSLPPMPENDYISSFDFINKDIGYVSTSRQHSSSYWSFIFKTTDGGSTWDTVGVLGNPLSHIHMIDSVNGIATSSTIIFRTADGWKNWKDVTPSGLYNVYNYPSVSNIVEIDNQHLIAVGGAGFGTDKGFVCISADGGLTWEYSLIEHTLRDVAVTSDKIFVCGEASYVARCDIDINNFSSDYIVSNLKKYNCSSDKDSDFIYNAKNPQVWGATTEFTNIQFTDDTHGFVSSNVYMFRITLK